MSEKTEEAEVKAEEAPKKEAPKKKKKVSKLTPLQRYFKIMKWIGITWMTIGLLLAIAFYYQYHPAFPEEIRELLFSSLNNR